MNTTPDPLLRADQALRDGNLDMAIKYSKGAVEAYPNDYRPYLILGIAYALLGEYLESKASLERSNELEPNAKEVYLAMANLSALCKEIDLDPIELLNAAIGIDPSFFEAHYALAKRYSDEGKFEEALIAVIEAESLQPTHIDTKLVKANCLRELKRLTECFDLLDKLSQVAGNRYELYLCLGKLFRETGDKERCLQALKKAYLLAKEKSSFPVDDLLLAKIALADWDGLQDLKNSYINQVNNPKAFANNLLLTLWLFDDPEIRIKSNKHFLRKESIPKSQHLQLCNKWVSKSFNRFKIAYLSADFRDHAMGYLTIGLFRNHDKLLFETFGISLTEKYDHVTEQLARHFDSFINVANMRDEEIANYLEKNEIDIVVDLMGPTIGHRLGVFQHLKKPIKVSYLGYPGPAASRHVDYTLADMHVIPAQEKKFYRESIAYLPYCYQVNDNLRAVNYTVHNLTPELESSKGCIFGCFNHLSKLTPEVFSTWMFILKNVPESNLVLIETSEAAICNIRSEATHRGVAPKRIIFLPHKPQKEHLARIPSIDLFLDTYPYGAHTSGSDALWCGVPLLTLTGKCFHTRVGESLLRAAGLPELICHSESEYVNKAIDLGRNKLKRDKIKKGLQESIQKSRLFDSPATTRAIEACFRYMIERRASGAAPISFRILAETMIPEVLG